MKTAAILSLAFVSSSLLACASTPKATPELDAARKAYVEAARGPAAQWAQGSLRSAHQTLTDAEKAARSGDALQGDRAVLARSRAELADARGRAAVALQERNVAAATLVRAVAEHVATAEQMAESQNANRPGAPTEGQANAQAEDDALHRMADREEPTAGGGREIVISSGLEFQLNEASLSPEARSKLDEVASALAREPNTSIRIDGFTDTSGTDAINEPLSKERARAVAGYIEQKGVAPERVTTQGLGSHNPVGDNATPDGRAKNRRAEISVEESQSP